MNTITRLLPPRDDDEIYKKYPVYPSPNSEYSGAINEALEMFCDYLRRNGERYDQITVDERFIQFKIYEHLVDLFERRSSIDSRPETFKGGKWILEAKEEILDIHKKTQQGHPKSNDFVFYHSYNNIGPTPWLDTDCTPKIVIELKRSPTTSELFYADLLRLVHTNFLSRVYTGKKIRGVNNTFMLYVGKTTDYQIPSEYNMVSFSEKVVRSALQAAEEKAKLPDSPIAPNSGIESLPSKAFVRQFFKRDIGSLTVALLYVGIGHGMGFYSLN